MAEHGEWSRKGATLSGATAVKEYGISDELIVKGIRAGKLEYRQGAVWGNPYLRILRSQLEAYIEKELGSKRFEKKQDEKELKKIKSEITKLKKRLKELDDQKSEVEERLGK